jgi:hypothetical protein
MVSLAALWSGPPERIEALMSKDTGRTGGGDKKPLPDAIQSVLEALSQLKFGAIQLTVHEGKLVQVDVTERKRFSN